MYHCRPFFRKNLKDTERAMRNLCKHMAGKGATQVMVFTKPKDGVLNEETIRDCAVWLPVDKPTEILDVVNEQGLGRRTPIFFFNENDYILECREVLPYKGKIVYSLLTRLNRRLGIFNSFSLVEVTRFHEIAHKPSKVFSKLIEHYVETGHRVRWGRFDKLTAEASLVLLAKVLAGNPQFRYLAPYNSSFDAMAKPKLQKKEVVSAIASILSK